MAASIPERGSPRISVNELARYMVSSDTARIGIIRRSKQPQTMPVIRYKEVRQVIADYLCDPIRRASRLTDGEEIFRQKIDDPTLGPMIHDDARRSLEVIAAVHRMANQLAVFDFHKAPSSQPKLALGGVEISTKLDLMVHGAHRGKDQIGGAVLRMTQDDAATDEAKAKRREMGLFAATLTRLHVEQNFGMSRQPAGRLCMSIDVQHGEVFFAPAAASRRISDLENACISIAALWDRV